MADNPPSYAAATTPQTTGDRPSRSGTHLEVPGRNNIPADRRRSMEDEGRELPPGWVRQYDAKSEHQFFVDTKADPPRAIWHHPYDDEDYLKTLTMEERERLQATSSIHRPPTTEDIEAESSADDDHTLRKSSTSGHPAPELPPRPEGKRTFGRKLKDSLTSSTHEEREARRRARAEEEERAYRAHLEMRKAMTRAAQTGQPQFLGKDPRTGQDVYMDPPPPAGYGGYPGGGYGYDPYTRGPYSHGGATYIPYPRPSYPYGRPYGYGYGGGLGLPLLGGLAGGALLGGLLF